MANHLRCHSRSLYHWDYRVHVSCVGRTAAMESIGRRRQTRSNSTQKSGTVWLQNEGCLGQKISKLSWHEWHESSMNGIFKELQECLRLILRFYLRTKFIFMHFKFLSLFWGREIFSFFTTKIWALCEAVNTYDEIWRNARTILSTIKEKSLKLRRLLSKNCSAP